VLVVGGGIVGAGVARDAAMRGLKVALIDRHDFAFGTSSRSSRLLHGGLRYLEQGRLGLVREASVEKKILRDIAPHLAQPLGFVFPAYRSDGRPLWQLKVGVKLYDLLCGGRNFQPSHSLDRQQTLAALPGLRPDGLLGAVRYFDALTNDARLVLDTLRSACAHGATVVNHVRFHEAEQGADEWVCAAEDVLAGSRFPIFSHAIVNTTGPWAQGLGYSAVKLRLTKGIHLVVDRRLLSFSDAVVISEGKRILFVIPWGERAIIGTTDTDHHGAPEDVVVLPGDVDYVLRAVEETFPDAALKRDDVICSWAGLRPLIANPDGSPSDISRAHQILNPHAGWWDVAGGKLTTYRLMAEQTVDRIVRHCGRGDIRCRTAEVPLLEREGEARFSGVLPPEFTEDAVAHFVRNEWAVSLEDVLVRRSGWHYYHTDINGKAEAAAGWMARLLAWPAGRVEQELASYRAGVSRPIGA